MLANTVTARLYLNGALSEQSAGARSSNSPDPQACVATRQVKGKHYVLCDYEKRAAENFNGKDEIMRNLRVGLSTPPDPYTDCGCFDDVSTAVPGPAVRAAQRRDDYVCQFCGFQSAKYQVCHGPEAGGADALVTACIFCKQVTDLDRVPGMRSAVLIWLPELSQAALNCAMPEVYVNRIGRDRAAGSRARDLLDRLVARREVAKTRFGSDDPAELVRRLRSAGDDRGEIDAALADGLRVLPLDRMIVRAEQLEFNQFPQILAFWRSRNGPFAAGRTRSFGRLELNLAEL